MSLKSFDVVGYVYRADIFCPRCAVEELGDDLGLGEHERDGIPETTLARIAREASVDIEDETTYDSDDFPKVIFRDQLEDDRCGRCGGEL